MIDTLILRINNITKYKAIYEQFYNPTKGVNAQSIGFVDTNTGELLQKVLVPSAIFHDTNRVLNLSYRSHKRITSSHYDLAYFINSANDHLEFNFSVPKYLYSCNVLQFINPATQTADIMFLMLKQFIRKFITENIIQIPLDEDIEINRVDFCYNQLFNSKDDAFKYLEEQKKLAVTYARSSKNNYLRYDSSFMYVTKNYSFKVYHKGTEFLKHDYKQLSKRNPLNLDLGKLQRQADCILRYEMTFRNKMFTYLTNHNYANSKSENYAVYSAHPVSRFYRHLKLTGMKQQAEKHKHKAKLYSLKSLFDLTKDTEILYHNTSMTFDINLFRFCYNAFWKKVNDYQIKKGFDSAEVLTGQVAARIKQRKEDEKIRRRFNDSQRGSRASTLLCAALLYQYINIDELKAHIPKRTFYRMKADLKAVGVTGKLSFDLPEPRTDYVDYLIYFLEEHNRLN